MTFVTAFFEINQLPHQLHYARLDNQNLRYEKQR